MSIPENEKRNGNEGAPAGLAPVSESYLQTYERLGKGAEHVIRNCGQILNCLAAEPEEGYLIRRQLGDKSNGKRGWMGPKRIIKNNLSVNPRDKNFERAFDELEHQGLIIVERARKYHSLEINTLRLNPEAVLGGVDLCYVDDDLREKLLANLESGSFVLPDDLTSSAQETPAGKSKDKTKKTASAGPMQPADEIYSPIGEISSPEPEISEAVAQQIPAQPSQLVAFEKGDMQGLLQNSVAIAKAILSRGERALSEPDSDMLLHTIAHMVCEPNIRLVEDTLNLAQEQNWIAMRIMADPPAKILVKKGFAKAVGQLIKNETTTGE